MAMGPEFREDPASISAEEQAHRTNEECRLVRLFSSVNRQDLAEALDRPLDVYLGDPVRGHDENHRTRKYII